MSQESRNPRQQARALLDSLSPEQVERALTLLEGVQRSRSPAAGLLGEVMGLELVESGEGFARFRLEVTERAYNPRGVVSGGVLFTMADYGMGAAVDSVLRPEEGAIALEIKINFIAPVTTGTIIADTRLTARTRRTAIFETQIRTEEGSLVALAIGTWYISRALG